MKSSREPSSPVRTPIILAKNDKSGGIEPRSAVNVTGRLWKPDDDSRSSSSAKYSNSIPSSLQSGELPPMPYRIQQRNDAKLGNGYDWTKTSLPTEAMKLVDEFMHWAPDSLPEYLLEQNDFRVVGVVGMEGAGKTHIMSLLATYPNHTKKSPFVHKDSKQADMLGHSTCGINAYVTSQRTILLDCQPLFSSSVFSHIVSNERRFSAVYTEHLNSEDIYETVNLELLMFMLAVCHIVIVVDDNFGNFTLHRALQTVDMLKPPQLPGEKQDEHNDFPSKIIFVQNIPSLHSPDAEQIEHIQATLSHIYKESTLNFNRKKMDNSIKVLHLLHHESGEKDFLTRRKILEQKLVQEILTLPVTSLISHTTLTEKNWLQYAGRMWEAVKKCPIVSEYMRLNQISSQ